MTTREQFDREIAAMVGELREVTMDVGSFLALSTEATNEQRLALAKLVHRYRPQVKNVRCSKGMWGLPADYVSFGLRDEAGVTFLVGGIDPEGRIST